MDLAFNNYKAWYAIKHNQPTNQLFIYMAIMKYLS